MKDNANAAQTATVYGDNTFARENVTLLNGNNTFTAVAQDSYGRNDTNTVISYLPSSSSCFYDLRGNLTNDGRRVFYYDDENQLTTVLVSNAWKSEFVYDGLMRRRVRKEFTWTGGAWLQTNEVRYIYDGRVVLQERFYVPAGSTLIPQNTVTYTRGNDLSGTLQGAGGIGGLLARSEISNLRSPHAYYHCDGNGNITALIDTNQVLVAQYHYDPYGNTLGMAGPLADGNLYRFSSKEFHPNSGLVYYLYRYYEPSLERWVNRDPIGEAGGINLYFFDGNAPTIATDPYGNDFSTWCGAGPAYKNWGSPKWPETHVEAAKGKVGTVGYQTWWPWPPRWANENKCNKFVGDCLAQSAKMPAPLIDNGKGGKRYPTAAEWADPDVKIPGFGPPHKGHMPGDVVTDSVHVGIRVEDGYIEAPSYGCIKFLPLDNKIWNPEIGRTPLPIEPKKDDKGGKKQ